VSRANKRSVALTIAGSDPGGGAGIQADLKTFAALGVYGYSAITAVIAQNSSTVNRVMPIDASMVSAQIETLAAERCPAAIKTGALGTAKIVEAVADALSRLDLPAPVVDPVLLRAPERDCSIVRANARCSSACSRSCASLRPTWPKRRR